MAASQLQGCGIVGAHHFDAFNLTEVRIERIHDAGKRTVLI